MNPLAGIPFLLGVAALIVLSGYWFSAIAGSESLAARVAQAALAGLASLLLAVSATNLFLPLSGVGCVLGLVPAMITVLWPTARRRLMTDCRTAARSRFVLLLAGLAAVLIAGLLRPALTDWQALFYDGTTNHDSYISTTAGEFLQSHTYLQSPRADALRPWMNMADDNVGWHPRRAQLGVETLLALFSSLVGTTPLHTILYFAAALLVPWTAAVYLAAITFFRPKLSRFALAALVLLQPIFVFFFANSNLPNLLGAMQGATVVIALEHALRAASRRQRLVWCGLLALGFHGLIAVYPEMLPFTLLPCGLLWLRPWLMPSRRTGRPATGWTLLAFAIGGVINPVVTLRAWHGFHYSFATARADVIFANLLEPLNAAEHVPGLVTLAIPAALRLGTIGGGLLSALLLAAIGTAWWRAQDRLGALCTLAGSAALLTYTLVTGFNYGWQKTIQFGAVFVVAFTTAPVIDALLDDRRKLGWARRFAQLGLVAILGFYAFATLINLQQIREWSRQKILSRDWFTLQQFAAATLRDRPVLIESASFRMPFFHSMWASYFLSPSHSYFAKRGGEGGGYLRLGVNNELAVPGGRPAALLVGRRWAESFDANSPRLLAGREYIFFRDANRVTELQGVYPVNGIPEHAQPRFAIELLPHSPSRLRITLEPYKTKLWPDATWRISRNLGGQSVMVGEVSGPPPWHFDIPLLGGQLQTVEAEIVSRRDATLEWPFAIRALTIESTP